MTFLDKTFCASPNCVNEFGRKMTRKEHDSLLKLAQKGLHWSCIVSQAYFCGEPENKSDNYNEHLCKDEINS